MSMGNASSANDAFLAGAKVGDRRFTLVRQLGRSGMGVVWLAHDDRLGEEVALKFLSPGIRHDASALEDMRRETLKSRKLSHPNIVRIHDLFEALDEPAFIAMEFIAGQPLSAIKAQQPDRLFSWDYLRPLVTQLCAALEYAHRSKVIHRDLKPANMMVDSEGSLKLADFGIAATAADSMSRVTQNMGSSGTPAYMSPQQLDGEVPRVTDDIYALGATLYELLTSKPPFYTGDVLNQVRNKTAKPLEQRLADLGLENAIPGEVSNVVLSCLMKDSARRPQSVAEVAAGLGFGGSAPALRASVAFTDAAAAEATPSDAFEAEPPSTPEAEGVTDGMGELSAEETIMAGQPAATNRRPLFAAMMAVAPVLLLGLGAWAIWGKKDGGKGPDTSSTEKKRGALKAEADQRETASKAALVAHILAPGERWTNTLGQIFVPVPGTEVQFCIWDTRVQDFEAFVKDTGHNATESMVSNRANGWKQHGDTWKSPGFGQTGTHPVCGVSWEDAQAFAKWLTVKEQKEGKLMAGQTYRLPTDWEWSVAVGLKESREGTPSEKNRKIGNMYPWGNQWPPPVGAGNYAGEEAKGGDLPADVKVIAGYHDGYPRTSPVGSFKANQYGLFDMGGNVWQWCEDSVNKEQKSRVMRGGAWIVSLPTRLLSASRNGAPPNFRSDSLGFRLVLVGMRP